VGRQDLSTEDGHPVDAKAKAEAFMATAPFAAMVKCFAAEVTVEETVAPSP
jgi:hypothetical protein